MPFVVEVKGSKFTVILREEDAGYSAKLSNFPVALVKEKPKRKPLQIFEKQ